MLEAIEKNIQFDRYEELSDLCIKNETFTENSNDTNELAFNNAGHLIETANNQKDFFFWYCASIQYPPMH